MTPAAAQPLVAPRDELLDRDLLVDRRHQEGDLGLRLVVRGTSRVISGSSSEVKARDTRQRAGGLEPGGTSVPTGVSESSTSGTRVTLTMEGHSRGIGDARRQSRCATADARARVSGRIRESSEERHAALVGHDRWVGLEAEAEAARAHAEYLQTKLDVAQQRLDRSTAAVGAARQPGAEAREPSREGPAPGPRRQGRPAPLSRATPRPSRSRRSLAATSASTLVLYRSCDLHVVPPPLGRSNPFSHACTSLDREIDSKW